MQRYTKANKLLTFNTNRLTPSLVLDKDCVLVLYLVKMLYVTTKNIRTSPGVPQPKAMDPPFQIQHGQNRLDTSKEPSKSKASQLKRGHDNNITFAAFNGKGTEQELVYFVHTLDTSLRDFGLLHFLESVNSLCVNREHLSA